MTNYEQLKAFERTIARDELGGGRTRRYMGTVMQAAQQHALHRLAPLNALKLTQTPSTIRACRSCRGTRYTAVEHITGQITLQKCLSCKGTGSVFG